MKAVRKLVVLFSVGAFGSIAASAKSVEQAYLENCRKDASVPVPVAVVTPSVSSDYAGATVELEFVVDQKGAPSALSVKSPVDAPLADAVVDAVKRWRFKPAERNGTPVAMKVVLPVKIVEPSLEGIRYAAN